MEEFNLSFDCQLAVVGVLESPEELEARVYELLGDDGSGALTDVVRIRREARRTLAKFRRESRSRGAAGQHAGPREAGPKAGEGGR